MTQDKVDYVRMILYADGKGDPSWKELVGLVFYYYTIKGPIQWNLDRYGTRLPECTRTTLHVAYSTLTDMQRRGVD